MWKYFLVWFIGFVMGGTTVLEIYFVLVIKDYKKIKIKYADNHNHGEIHSVPPSQSPVPKPPGRQK